MWTERGKKAETAGEKKRARAGAGGGEGKGGGVHGFRVSVGIG